ncbi:MAG: YciI family protein [Gemmatimonadaceae bacterium]
MRFMIIRRADKETEAGMMPSGELLAAMMKYNEEMVNAGVMLAGEGLKPSAHGARVKFSNGKPVITDGPFAETKELIAGYSMIQVKSMQEALEWVQRWPSIDAHGEVELEIRPLLEAEDFGDAFTPEMQAQEDRLRAHTGGKP